jgi:translation initiation factor IF-3
VGANCAARTASLPRTGAFSPAQAVRRLSSAAGSSSKNDAVLEHAQVRLIGLDGKNRGVVAGAEALRAARAEGVDLVEAKSSVVPPVWKLVPREAPRARGVVAAVAKAPAAPPLSFKEVRLTLGVAEHDLLTKIRQIYRFVEKGQRTRIKFKPATRAVDKGDAHTLLARINAELQGLGATVKVTRKDPQGKPLEVDFVPRETSPATAVAAGSTTVAAGAGGPGRHDRAGNDAAAGSGSGVPAPAPVSSST